MLGTGDEPPAHTIPIAIDVDLHERQQLRGILDLVKDDTNPFGFSDANLRFKAVTIPWQHDADNRAREPAVTYVSAGSCEAAGAV